MSKIGRNDPCPCGSGKKYKKCCLAQDEQRRRDDARPDDLSALFDDIPDRGDLFDEQDEPEACEDEEPSDAGIDEEPYVGKTISDEAPEISDEEQALVDAWWDDYEKLKDPDDILRHLNGFLGGHPDLVENLALHNDVLFGLGQQLVEAGRAGEYIGLLKQVRERFPRAYLKSYSYYDRDIIIYEVIERGCSADIEGYLGWFEDYPEAAVDNLFPMLDLLMVTECDEAVMRLLEATYYPLCRSTKVFGGEKLLDPLVVGYLAPFLDDGVTASDARTLVERLQRIRIRLRAEWYEPPHLQAIKQEITGEPGAGLFDSFDATQDLAQYYARVTRNFMGWLRREKGFSWMKAHFYRDQVMRYLLRVVPEGKRPKQPFTFTKKLLDRTLAGNARELLSLDATRALGSINAVYWFAEYLAQGHAITDELAADVQRWCEEFWNATSQAFRSSTIEAGAFKTFPQ